MYDNTKIIDEGVGKMAFVRVCNETTNSYEAHFYLYQKYRKIYMIKADSVEKAKADAEKIQDELRRERSKMLCKRKELTDLDIEHLKDFVKMKIRKASYKNGYNI